MDLGMTVVNNLLCNVGMKGWYLISKLKLNKIILKLMNGNL